MLVYKMSGICISLMYAGAPGIPVVHGVFPPITSKGGLIACVWMNKEDLLFHE